MFKFFLFGIDRALVFGYSKYRLSIYITYFFIYPLRFASLRPCLFVTLGIDAITVLIALRCALCFENIDFCVGLFVYSIESVLFPGFPLLCFCKAKFYFFQI